MGITFGLSGIAWATPRVFNALYPPTIETERREATDLPLGTIQEKVNKLFALGIFLRKKINQLVFCPRLYNFCTVILPDNLWLSILAISFLWSKISLAMLNLWLALGIAGLGVPLFCFSFHDLRKIASHFVPLRVNRLIAPSPFLSSLQASDSFKIFLIFCVERRKERAAERRAEEYIGDRIPKELHGNSFFSAYECPISGEPIRYPLRDPTTALPLHDLDTGLLLRDSTTGFPLRDPNTGTIYEASEIILWVREHGRSPISHIPLRVEDLQLVPELQAEINEMLRLYGML